jgi:hypothetical protein
MPTVLESASVGVPITRAGVSFMPLYIHQPPIKITSGDRAGLEVTEQAQANVPSLQFYNPTDAMALVPAGTVVTGGQQNRVVNVPVLVPGRANLDVPVSCVQAGRWNGGREFDRQRRLAPRRVREANARTVNERIRHGYKGADQGEIWREVDDMLRGANVESSSRDLRALDEVLRRDRRRAEAISELTQRGPLPGQSGVIVFHGTKVISADVFATPELLVDNWASLVESQFLEDPIAEGRPSANRALRFIRRFAHAPAVRTPGVGLGGEVHVTSPRITGQALMLDDLLVYGSCFALAA